MEYDVTITIPGPIQPLERGDRFELPLCDLFDQIGGDIVASGTLVGNGSIVEAVIEVTVSRLDEAVPGIVKILSHGDAPQGTTVILTKPERRQLYVVRRGDVGAPTDP